MKIAIAQINPVVGDIPYNRDRIIECIRRAAGEKADLVVFSEMSLVGYPPMDLLLNPQLIDDNLAALHEIAAHSTECAALVGFACRHTGEIGREFHNAAALLGEGQIKSICYKRLLPNYDVFDERRYFEPGGPQAPINLNNIKLGVTICEDLWSRPKTAERPYYQANPTADLANQGAEIIINLSAIPFAWDKQAFRFELFAHQARTYNLPLINVNQVGGNDELIFDGASCAYDSKGKLLAQAHAFQEDFLIIDFDHPEQTRREDLPAGMAAIHGALVLGLRDYVRKCGFESVILGLSGGIDSAVVACLAVGALGLDKVHAVALPSRYSSGESFADAERLARNLGIKLLTIPIEKPHIAMEEVLRPWFAGREAGVAEENIQSRIRGTILMALSNKFGHLVLATGNKSELATGYCTLYGDMAGGLAVISDLMKTQVYELARFINREREIIPESIIAKVPTAELKPNQTDQDTLPPYDLLDAILELYVVQNKSFNQIVSAGYDPDLVGRIIKMVDGSEFKRRQIPPGLKISSRAFGIGRRMPVAQNFQISTPKK